MDAARVVGEVEVEDDLRRIAAEVGPLGGIEQIAAPAVRLSPAGCVPERQEDAAAVALESIGPK